MLEEMVQNNQKTGIYAYFGAIWAPPNGPKKGLKGWQEGRMYGPMSNLKDKPLTKLLGLFF
jgi:hypothetical protein